MVDIVVSLPPRSAETTAVTSYEHGQSGIDVEIVGDAHVRSIVDQESKLVP